MVAYSIVHPELLRMANQFHYVCRTKARSINRIEKKLEKEKRRKEQHIESYKYIQIYSAYLSIDVCKVVFVGSPDAHNNFDGIAVKNELI